MVIFANDSECSEIQTKTQRHCYESDSDMRLEPSFCRTGSASEN